jgi:hypothetical protein
MVIAPSLIDAVIAVPENWLAHALSTASDSSGQAPAMEGHAMRQPHKFHIRLLRPATVGGRALAPGEVLGLDHIGAVTRLCVAGDAVCDDSGTHVAVQGERRRAMQQPARCRAQVMHPPGIAFLDLALT